MSLSLEALLQDPKICLLQSCAASSGMWAFFFSCRGASSTRKQKGKLYELQTDQSVSKRRERTCRQPKKLDCMGMDQRLKTIPIISPVEILHCAESPY